MIPVLGQDMFKFEEACLKQLVLKIQTVMHLNVFRQDGMAQGHLSSTPKRWDVLGCKHEAG